MTLCNIVRWGFAMPDKINVIMAVDEEGRNVYTVSAFSLSDLAHVLGVTEEQFVVREEHKLTRQRQLQQLNRRLNTPEAIRRRTELGC